MQDGLAHAWQGKSASSSWSWGLGGGAEEAVTDPSVNGSVLDWGRGCRNADRDGDFKSLLEAELTNYWVDWMLGWEELQQAPVPSGPDSWASV